MAQSPPLRALVVRGVNELKVNAVTQLTKVNEKMLQLTFNDVYAVAIFWPIITARINSVSSSLVLALKQQFLNFFERNPNLSLVKFATQALNIVF